MSTVVCSEIRDISGNILVPSYGSVISTAFVRYQTRAVFAGNNWTIVNNTNRIAPLRLTINASHPNNIIIAQWQLFVECSHNITFSVLKNLSQNDGSLGITRNNTSTNEGGYWRGYVPAYWDNDVASTPQNIMLQWIGRAGVKGNVDLDICFHWSSSTGNIFMNRNANNTGSDGNEVGVSTGIAFEVTSQGGEG
jgi:hypothetical protein